VKPAALLVTLPLALAAAACEHPGGRSSPEDLGFAQAACGGCHAVERYGASPNPDSPPFAAIVNREGLTRATLTTWLRDAHNYPEEMEFTLGAPEVERLVDHMLTLRGPDYRPAI
jgi:hypothetical protein